MKTINPSRPPHPCATPAFFFSITIAVIAIVCTAGTQAQPSSAYSAPIDAFLSRLKSAIDRHEPAAHRGILWHSHPNGSHLHHQSNSLLITARIA